MTTHEGDKLFATINVNALQPKWLPITPKFIFVGEGLRNTIVLQATAMMTM